MININITALFQLLSFLFLLFVLKKVLFEPVLRILDERKETLGSYAKAVQECRRRAEETLGEYRREIADARRQALHIQEQTEKEALESRTEMLSQKRAEAQARLAELREQLEREVAGQADALRRQVEPLRDFVVQRVLRESSGSVREG
jgi:F-type H+-transporting ATPase subunit b